MAASVSAVGRTLRSRRLAVWLLSAVGAWSVLGTLIPQTSLDPRAAETWAAANPGLESIVSILGLHHAFRAPIFLAVVVLLAVSTLLCAWERTAAAQRTLGAAQSAICPREVVVNHAHISVAVPQILDAAAAETAVRAALRRMRLRVSSLDGVMEGSTGRWSVFGSPVFHWALAMLIIVIGMGQLTRAEGLIGVPENEVVLDIAESYGVLTEGPWYTGHSGYGIGISDFERSYYDGTVDRGASPVVTLFDGDIDLVSKRVYPNQPLRYKDMLIHMNAWGYAPEVGSTTAEGEYQGSLKMIVDVEEGMPRSTTSGFDVVSPTDGSTTVFQATLVAEEDAPKLEIIGLAEDGSEVARAKLGIGEELMLPNGDRIEYRELHYYARLSVVQDWSVSPMYVLFIVGLMGVSVAVLDPQRRIAIVVSESQETPTALAVYVLIRHGRQRALFVERVTLTIESALCAAAENASIERDCS